jgi:malonyl-CoA decarboxylase
MRDSFGLMVNYRYVPDELEENHERYVRDGEVRVSPELEREQRIASGLWHGETPKKKTTTAIAAVQ